MSTAAAKTNRIRRAMKQLEKEEKGLQAIMTEIGHLHDRDDAIESRMEAIAATTNSKIDGLTNAVQHSLTQQGKTNWQSLSVMLVAIGMVGTLVWYPIQHRLNRLEEHSEKEGHPETVLLEVQNLREKMDVEQTYRDKIRDLENRNSLNHRMWLEERVDRIDYYGSARWNLGTKTDSTVHAPHPTKGHPQAP